MRSIFLHKLQTISPNTFSILNTIGKKVERTMVDIQKVKNRIKNSEVFGRIYYGVGLTIVKFLQLFIRPVENRILFMSYSGRQYSDSPKEAYLELLNDPYFEGYELVWAFNNPDKFNDAEIGRKVSSNSPLFFIELLRSKYWVANSSIERLIPFSHKRNVYIQFWHGIPMKSLGQTELGLAPLVRNWYNKAEIDYLFTCGEYDTAKMREVFPTAKRTLEVGLMRKKEYLRETKDVSVDDIKAELGITSDLPILLYVPTFRGYKPKIEGKLTSDFFDQLADKYTILYRGHYYSKHKAVGQVISVSNQPLVKMFKVADAMVTDYSSVLFDFAPLHKPIYLYQRDLDEYLVRRGMNLSAKELGLPVAHTENELLWLMNQPYNMKSVERLAKKFNNHAADESVTAFKNIVCLM